MNSHIEGLSPSWESAFARLRLASFAVEAENLINFTESELAKENAKCSSNDQQTSKNFARWYAAQPSWPIQLVVSEHSPTDYWRLCYEDDPIVTGSDPPSPLTRLVHSRKLPGVLPFGKCRGTLLSINPLPNCFPLPEEIDAIPNEWGNAPECTKAVSYAEGYPSEGQTRLRSTIRSDDDDTLCRFSSLGWVYAEESGVQGKKEWKRTGHVLVMDMDRDRHPWIILAPRWENGEDTAYGEELFWELPQTVSTDDRSELARLGTLSGTNSRTTIGRIVCRHDASTEPLLCRLNKDLDIDIDRMGFDRAEKTTNLAVVVDWYLDPVKKEHVCYNDDGRVFMRYNPERKEYTNQNPQIIRDPKPGSVRTFPWG